MTTTITLDIEQEVLEKAKKYAMNQQTSLSKVVENNVQMEISPLVKSLSTKINIPVDWDYKKEYADYLAEKYK
jgi:hypothetical protein